MKELEIRIKYLEKVVKLTNEQVAIFTTMSESLRKQISAVNEIVMLQDKQIENILDAINPKTK